MISKRSLILGAAALVVLGVSAGAMLAGRAEAAIQTGAAAPAFSVTDSNGQTRTLAEFSGKTVVLEWTNKDCPFVVRQYNSGNMQATQHAADGHDVVWLQVISSAPGEQGHLSPAQANANVESVGAHVDGVLLDPSGAMGRAYGATNTPHMYVINGEGVLVYQGAIDSRATANANQGFDGVTNYVNAALADLAAGRPVATAETRAYGCNVKYAG